LIVARLWNVFQFWYIYQAEPVLIFSIRPSGFEFWPGLVAALVAGYVYLLRRALDPVRVGAALAAGLVAGSILQGLSGYATGALLGTASDGPWAMPYFGEMRHPAGLYLAAASLILSIVLWLVTDEARPGRTFLLALLGYSLVRLVVDGFVDQSARVVGVRASQVIALAVALGTVLLLARGKKSQEVEQGETTRPTTEGDATS
jgi:phosphatidylglycerol:prolipoprotein diacylglycerol transferase